MQLAAIYTAAILGLVALAHSSSIEAAGGIKGQQQLQRTEVKGPRQQQLQPQQATKSNSNLLQQQQQAAQTPAAPTKLGPGQFSPVFSSKRPVQPQQPVIIQQQRQQEPQPQQEEQQQEIQQQQQQQSVEASEIDPNADAQGSAPAVLAPNTAALAPAEAEEANPKPEPYAFNYAFDASDAVSSGSSAREEQQDASGRVTGFYTLKGQDGRDRRVDYVADASGFRATISTNELGTAPKDPADARFQAQAPSDGQLRAAESATEAARQRQALLAPSQQQQPQQAPFFQQQDRLPAASSASASTSKSSPPRASAASKAAPQQQQVVQIRQEAEPAEQAAIVQLQEPFEQIRQTELNSRTRKSRHAPFYLFTI